MSVHKISLLQSKPCGWNSFGTSPGYSGLFRSSWSRISILFQRGYCGNGIHCTGSLATWNCWLLEYWGFLRNLWKSCSRLELCRNWFLLALPWLDEVDVSPEALSSCWNLNHVELGSLHFSCITASSHFLESEFWSHTFCPASNGNALILSWKSLTLV